MVVPLNGRGKNLAMSLIPVAPRVPRVCAVATPTRAAPCRSNRGYGVATVGERYYSMRLGVILMAILAAGRLRRQLAPSAENIRLVTVSPKVQGCERVKLITVNQRSVSDKPGNAMRKAMNEPAQGGANRSEDRR